MDFFSSTTNHISDDRTRVDDKIIGWLSPFGLGWLAFAWYVWDLPWFWSESINGSPGSEWWSLLAILLTSIALTPLGLAYLTLNWRGKEVTAQWKNETGWLILGGVPFASIWAALWLYCLPNVWTLLPWGSWDLNWWKIFPYIFGLIPMGALPLLGVIIEGTKKLRNPIYISDQMKAFGDRVLKNGMKGDDVLELQKLLNKHGSEIIEDGEFGNQTDTAVREFQRITKIFQSGIVDDETVTALNIREDVTNEIEERLTSLRHTEAADRITGSFSSILDGLEIPEE